MKLKNIAGAFLALAGLAFGGVAAAGDIYEIRPCDELGISIPAQAPDVYLQGGDTAYFKIRLAKRSEYGKQFHLTYRGRVSPSTTSSRGGTSRSSSSSTRRIRSRSAST